MRRAIFVLVPLSIAAFAFACDEDTPPPPDLALPEAGGLDVAQPPIDSSAPPPDAPIDVVVPATVTVTVVGAAGPRPSVRVVFHDAAGAVLETKLTGVDGKATSAGALPAMASVLLATSTQRQIITWTGVEAGDDLQVRDLEEDVGDLAGQYSVSLAGLFDDAGAIQYRYRSSECDNFGQRYDGQTAVALDMYRACVRPQNAVLVEAEDEGAVVIGHAFKKNNAPPVDGGAVAVTTGGFLPAAAQVVNGANAPGVSASARLVQVANGGPFEAFQPLLGGTTSFPIATGFADALQASVEASPQLGAFVAIARRVTPPVAAGAFDFDFLTGLPVITAATLATPSARRPTLAWTSAGSLAGSDGGVASVRFFTGEDASFSWSFIVPPTATSVAAPAMPPEADAWLPLADAGAAAYGPPQITFAESDLLPSYAAFRKLPGVVLGAAASGRAGVLPQNGTLKLTRFGGGRG